RTKDPGCPWELDRVALHALEKDRDARYQTAFELKADVDAWLAGRPVAAAKGGALYRAAKLARRNRGGVALAAAGLLALALGGGLAWRKAGATERAERARAAGLVRAAAADLGEARRGRAD